MKLRYKLAAGFLVLGALFMTSFALVLSHDSECGQPPGVTGEAALMKAVTYRCYGSPDVLEVDDINKPAVGEDGILVKVHAASINPLDWHYMRGSPYIMRLETGLGAPKSFRLGVDFAGIVESIGGNVKAFKPGDGVFGEVQGAFAQYVVMRENQGLARIPAGISFEQAAAIPVAGVTALQALRDHGKIKPGQEVLINGASGGVGTFAVQIAKSFGAQVTGVCSNRNVEMVRSLGADHVIDYTREDYTEMDPRYDLIIDNVGNHSVLANSRVLKTDGRLIVVGAQQGDWVRPLAGVIQIMVLSPFIKQEMKFFVAEIRKDDLAVLADLMRKGEVSAVIDRRFPLAEIAQAMRYSEAGHARGKLIIQLP